MSIARQKLIDRLMVGVGEDVRDYRTLIAALEEQFTVAVRHDGAAMDGLTRRIETLVDRLEARRSERVRLVEQLHGKGARMTTAIEALPDPRRKMLAAGWSGLEQLVLRCKQLNERNCALMTDQHDVMHRVMHGEGHTYAPA